MADKSTIMRSFNTHFVEMISDILSSYPNNTELKSGLNSFEMIKNLVISNGLYSKMHYILLFKTKEFVDSNQSIYKFGKTTKSN